jgi:hypothetical protein
MPTEYNSFQIAESLENIWIKTLAFWGLNKGEIKEEAISKNSLYRYLKIKTEFRMQSYGFSFGELYIMNFGFDVEKKCTIITIEVKYSIFGGRGFIWKFPQETMNNWAKEMNLNPVKLKNEPFPLYLEEKDRMKQIANQADISSIRFCVHCGAKNSSFGKNCTLCGAEL